MTIPLALYDRARAAIAPSFDATAQTKIALFVGTAKVVNAAIMFGFEMQPGAGVAYPFIHGQYFRESEFASLLARVTRWSPQPQVYLEAASVTAPLWLEWSRLCVDAFRVPAPRVMYAGLALGHALLARVRLAPVIHEDADPLDPFVVAIRRIEQEGGRMIQAQIRLLQDGGVMLDALEREKMIEERQASIDEAFARFLGWLAGDTVGVAALPQPLPTIMESIGSLPFAAPANDFLRALRRVAQPFMTGGGNA